MRARMTDALVLRGRQLEDRAGIHRLAVAAFAEYSSYAGRGAPAMLERLPVMIVACRGGEVVGFAGLEFGRAGEASLPAIAVDERERGHGLGRRLLRAAEHIARARGARHLTLHTAQANLAAFELFAKNGYEVERRIPRYYRGVFDACAMRKHL